MNQEMKDKLCRRCGGQMKPSKAIAQTWAGTPEWPGDTICTMLPSGPGTLIDCLKCEQCGHSITYSTASVKPDAWADISCGTGGFVTTDKSLADGLTPLYDRSALDAAYAAGAAAEREACAETVTEWAWAHDCPQAIGAADAIRELRDDDGEDPIQGTTDHVQ